MSALLAGLLLGLGGGAHCAAMCGPLVLTVGPRTPSGRPIIAELLLYHAGRVLMYVLLAVPIGLGGGMLSSGWLGRAVAVASGLVLLLFAMRSASPRVIRRLERSWSSAMAPAWGTASRVRRTRPALGSALAGVLNGLLPCGLVYAAAIAAGGLGSLSGAVLFMVGFGAATTSVLVAVPMLSSWFPQTLRARLGPLTPAALILVATLLIARGLMPPPPMTDPRSATTFHHHAR